MRNVGLHKRQTRRAFGHLERVVRAEVPSAHDLRHRGGTHELGAHDLVADGLKEQVFLLHFAAHHLGGVHHGVHQRLIARAAAKVLVIVEPLANLLAGGGWVLSKQRLGAHDEAGRAEAALRAAVAHPRKLQRMQVFRAADALDGLDFRTVLKLAHLEDTGALRLAVYQHRAGAALPHAAGNLTARKVLLLAQDLSKGIVGIDDNRLARPVDR